MLRLNLLASVIDRGFLVSAPHLPFTHAVAPFGDATPRSDQDGNTFLDSGIPERFLPLQATSPANLSTCRAFFTVMTTKQASDIVRSKLTARYPGYWKFEASERIVLAAAILADDVKVREKSGLNDGAWVGAILGSTGLGEGFAWCAATVEFCCEVAGVKGQGSAGVMNWLRWFQKNLKIVKPARGTAAMKDYGGGKGHMGVVVSVLGPIVTTIEGNTSPGESGSQRDGQGLYRRRRLRSWWTAFGAF